jgi:hypothetical protein
MNFLPTFFAFSPTSAAKNLLFFRLYQRMSMNGKFRLAFFSFVRRRLNALRADINGSLNLFVKKKCGIGTNFAVFFQIFTGNVREHFLFLPSSFLTLIFRT